MGNSATVGIDLAKTVFQPYGIDAKLAAPRRVRSCRSLYERSDGVRGRGASPGLSIWKWVFQRIYAESHS